MAAAELCRADDEAAIARAAACRVTGAWNLSLPPKLREWRRPRYAAGLLVRPADGSGRLDPSVLSLLPLRLRAWDGWASFHVAGRLAAVASPDSGGRLLAVRGRADGLAIEVWACGPDPAAGLAQALAELRGLAGYKRELRADPLCPRRLCEGVRAGRPRRGARGRLRVQESGPWRTCAAAARSASARWRPGRCGARRWTWQCTTASCCGRWASRTRPARSCSGRTRGWPRTRCTRRSARWAWARSWTGSRPPLSTSNLLHRRHGLEAGARGRGHRAARPAPYGPQASCAGSSLPGWTRTTPFSPT
jgi:hypothetical protein